MLDLLSHQENINRNYNGISSYPLCVCLLVAQSCPTLCAPVNYNPLGSSVHGISQARILKWIAIFSSRNLPDPGVNLHLLHWQMASLPPSCLGGPQIIINVDKNVEKPEPSLTAGGKLKWCRHFLQQSDSSSND